MKCKEIFQMVGKPIETSKRRITADKREIKDFPKPSPLCILLEGKRYYKVQLARFHNESKIYGLEGWASFIRKPLPAIIKDDTAKNEKYELYRQNISNEQRTNNLP